MNKASIRKFSLSKNHIIILLVLILSVFAGFETQSQVAVPLGIFVLLIGYLVYSRFGLNGLLCLFAGLTWYPIKTGPLHLYLSFFWGNSFLEGIICILGIAILVDHFLHPKKNISLLVPFITLSVASIGWLFTLTVAPYSQTIIYFRELMYLMCVFVLCIQIIDTPRQAELICWVAIVSFTLSVLIIFIGFYIYPLPFFFIPKDQLGAYAAYSTRLQGAYQLPGGGIISTWAPRLSGVVASVIMFPLVSILNKRYSFFARLAIAILVVFLGMVLLSTWGRGGWLAFTIAFALVSIISVRYKILSFNSLIPLALIIGVLYVFTLSYFAKNYHFTLRVNSLLAIQNDLSFINRVDYWRRNLAIWLAHPWVGIGFDSLLYRYGFFEHNVFLILLNGIGPYGLLSYLFFWIWVGFRSIVTVHKYHGIGQMIGLVALGSLVATLIGGFVENVPFLSESFWFIWGSAVALSYRVPEAVSEITIYRLNRQKRDNTK